MNDLSQAMPIYNNSLIWNELQSLGKDEGSLCSEELSHLDQLHYLGSDAVENAARHLEITERSHVLDIGSGLGGPARYLASKYGCQVTGVELQPNLCQTSRNLTERCGLSEQVHFLEGDFTNLEFGNQRFSGWMSLLAFLHIPDKNALFSTCARVSIPGTRFYIEDFFIIRALPDEERTLLREKVACLGLQTRAQYISDLRAAGFDSVCFEDVTEVWSHFVAQRYQSFKKDFARLAQVHGYTAATKLGDFYQTIDQLLSGGNVGGARISGVSSSGRRPD